MTPELSIVIKATVALAAGLTAAALASRARAAVRHVVLAATLGAVAALPLGGALLPALTVAVELPAAVTTPAPVSTPVAAADAAAGGLTTAAPAVVSTPSSVRRLSLSEGLRLLWAGGVVLLVGVLLHALWKVRQIRRTAIPWLDQQVVVDRFARDGGVTARVAVVLHEDVPSPVTCGWRRPVIVMPEDARSWSTADLERAFVHELEHVRRHDWIVQLGARLVCAAYWFHPLVWVAWRRLCLECERACDDAVVARSRLRQGYGGQVADADYAEQLVALAGRFAGAGADPVMSMARRSDLTVRVRAVLDRTQLRGPASIAAVMATVVLASTLALVLAPMQVEAVPAEALASAPASQPTPAGSLLPEAAMAQSRRAINVSASRRAPRTGVLGRALVEAANEDDLESVRELLAAGADVNAVVQGDGTALLIAAREGHQEMVELLLQRGAEVDIPVSGDGSALIMAAREGYRDIVRLLIDRGANVNIAVRGDGSPLIMAAREGFRDIARILIDGGADVNLAVAGDGNPLIMAAREGHLELTRMLLDRGAQVNDVVPGDENALIGASQAGYLTVVQLLVSRGADVNSRVWVEHWDERGTRRGEWRTPLSVARREGYPEVVRYLQSVGATD